MSNGGTCDAPGTTDTTINAEAAENADSFAVRASRAPARLPARFRQAGAVIRGAGEHEQQVREPVDVLKKDGVNGRRQRHHLPLRAAADRSRHMERRAGRRSARQNEEVQRRQLAVQALHQRVEPRDVGGGDERLGVAIRQPLGRVGELSADREQIALNLEERRVDVGIDREAADVAKPRVELVDFAVGVDPRIGFADAILAEERSLAGVAGSRVDFHGRLDRDYMRCL
jgi:hypothetical protein